MRIRLVRLGDGTCGEGSGSVWGGQDLEGVRLCFPIGDAGQHLRKYIEEEAGIRCHYLIKGLC